MTPATTPRLLQMSGVIADLIYRVETVPRPGQEAIVTDFEIAPGGGFNAMVAARQAGMQVSYGGSLGTGPFADVVARGLQRHAIEILRQRDPARDQGCCTVMIDAAGERTFVAAAGAEGHLSASEIDAVATEPFGWTLLSGYALHYRGSRRALGDWLARTDLPNLVFDPSPVVAALDPALLAVAVGRARWISANLDEARVIAGTMPAPEVALCLARGRPDGGAVLRDGARGCYLAQGGQVTHIPALEVQAVDTNGAGDTHVGSFIAELSRTGDALRAARYANIAAALSTTRHGPATAPTRAEVLGQLETPFVP
ncbi:PfkB family carbohydrate kinase [Puniceibacterium confluentis]|uniref:PfkB family carbohydrate kinase n=1 Tax=Puniceibacterium confluentis TaxID=1958944 RepID=UPI0011B6F905|nr:PfkB family carbohydrate kinase [Puniceibacterium confluentis]